MISSYEKATMKMASQRAKRVKPDTDEYAEARSRWVEKLKSLSFENTQFTDAQKADFVRRYFVQLEQEAIAAPLDLVSRRGQELDAEEVAEMVMDLWEHVSHYEGASASHPLDLDRLVEEVCVEERLYVRIPRLETPIFGALLAQAKAEHYRRRIQRLKGQRETNHYVMFEGLHAGSHFETPEVAAASSPIS